MKHSCGPVVQAFYSVPNVCKPRSSLKRKANDAHFRRLDPDFKRKFEALGFEVLRKMRYLNPGQAMKVRMWFRQVLRREPDLSGFIRRGYILKSGRNSFSVGGGM